jgi:F0F1-type ATP synthase membrane subunit b/b'
MANKKVNKVGKEFDKVVDEMKKLAPKFAKASGAEKDKILKKLKELTAKKKDLKAEIERSVMDAEKDIDLQIEIKSMIKSVLAKSLNEVVRRPLKSNIVQNYGYFKIKRFIERNY